jgi:hypothetical protein
MFALCSQTQSVKSQWSASLLKRHATRLSERKAFTNSSLSSITQQRLQKKRGRKGCELMLLLQTRQLNRPLLAQRHHD